MYKIYKYTNKINNKIYIGQTCKSLEERAQKGRNYKGSRHFYNAIQKYGWDNFTVEILEDNLTCEEANEREVFYIALYNSTDIRIGYNLREGGLNSAVSEETRKKISQNAIERYKDKTKNPMYGKKHSQETLNKMSQCKIGEKNPMYGKKLSEESRRKISEYNKLHKDKITHTFTEQERQKMSERMKIQAQQWAKKIYCIEDNLYFDSITQAANYYNVAVSTLSGHLNKRQKVCKNKHFEYVNNVNV